LDRANPARTRRLAFIAQGGKGTKLIERMKRFAFGVFGETAGFDEAFAAFNPPPFIFAAARCHRL
jgi:hypothetical protein